MALNASAVELELNHVRRQLVARARATGLTPTAVIQEHRAYREGIQRAQRSQFMTQKLLSTQQHALLFGLCGNQISSAHSTKAILLRVTQVTA